MSSKTKTTATKEEATPALLPKLRFSEFRELDGWTETQLQKIAQPVSDRAVTGDGDNVLSLSGEHGLVLQSDYFGKKIAGESADRYLKLLRNDFVYNDRTTKASTFGTIKRLSKYEGGIVSPIYKCFRFHGDENPVFWEWYFESGNHDAALRGLVNEGARAGRFNISITQFLSTAAPRPDEAEQQKVAECLSSVDELIAAQARKLDALKTHKKGLMQQLFPREGETQPRLRFPEFQNAGDWMVNTLDDIATFRRGSFPQPYGLPDWYDDKNGTPFIQVFDVGDNFRLKDKTKSKISKLGAEKSVFIPEGTLIVTLQGSIGRVAITHYDAYIDRTLLIFESFQKPIEKVFFARVIQNLFDIEKEKAPGGIIKTITKEALSDFTVKYPTIAEQQRIADCLTSLDDLIAAQTQKHEALKTHKKGLMQQLFPSPEEVEA
jgi:type I restriction enzyme S subunit